MKQRLSGRIGRSRTHQASQWHLTSCEDQAPVIPRKLIEVESRIFSYDLLRRFCIKKSRFTDSQILAILKEAEGGQPVPTLCREHGMSSAIFYKWRAKYGVMGASLMTRMKELEDENRRLKKIYAEERLISEVRNQALRESGKAISASTDG